MQDGAVKDEESIKHSDVLVEDPEKIEKHAKEPEELERKRLETEKIFRQSIKTEARRPGRNSRSLISNCLSGLHMRTPTKLLTKLSLRKLSLSRLLRLYLKRLTR